MPAPPDPRFTAANLETARIRDLLGDDLADLPLGERVLAQSLNRIESGDVPDLDLGDVVPVIPPAVRVRRLAHQAVGVAASLVLVLAVVIGVQLAGAGPAYATPPILHYSLADPSGVLEAQGASPVLHAAGAHSVKTAHTGAGDVELIASRNWFLSVTHRGLRILPTTLERWRSPDGSVTVRETVGAPLRHDGTLDPANSEPATKTVEESWPPESVLDTAASLPLRPHELRRTLLDPSLETDLSTDEVTALLFGEVIAQMSTRLLPPDLIAAMWEMLALDPGIRTLGTTTDRLGRPAVAITAPPLTSQVKTDVTVALIDPETGHLLGTETVTLHSEDLGIDEPTVTGFTTITDARFVEQLGDS